AYTEPSTVEVFFCKSFFQSFSETGNHHPPCDRAFSNNLLLPVLQLHIRSAYAGADILLVCSNNPRCNSTLIYREWYNLQNLHSSSDRKMERWHAPHLQARQPRFSPRDNT